jgi:hypothetical protein
LFQGTKLHHSKVRKIAVIHPYGLRWVRMNLKDLVPFSLNDTPACRKKSPFIKIGLGGRDVTIVERDSLFPPGENFRELGIMLRISHLDFHHLHFVSAPELPLSGPLVFCRPSLFLKRMKQGEKILFFSPSIESRSEGVFESAKRTIFTLDPKDHRGLQRIEIEEPSPKFHKITSQKRA